VALGAQKVVEKGGGRQKKQFAKFKYTIKFQKKKLLKISRKI